MAEQKNEAVPPDDGGYNDGNMYGDGILKQGSLQKKGTGLTSALSWNKRYFILTASGDFSYYKDKNYQQKVKNIDLRKVYKVERSKDKKYLYLQTKERKWDLYSDNISELDEWDKLLRTASTKEDWVEFRIKNAECAPFLCNQLYGFVGEGLHIQITSKLDILSEITFCSFIYPKEEKTISINSDTIELALDGQNKCFKLDETHIYERKIEKKSVNETTVLSNALMQKQEDMIERLQNFVDNGDEKKYNYNDNDIYVNVELKCNFSVNAQHTLSFIGQIKKGLFGKSDNRKLQGTVEAFLTAFIKVNYDILNKNDDNTREQWWIYRNRLMEEAFEQKRLEFEGRIDELVVRGRGNRINLLPFYMKQKIPMKEYELKPIWNRILNTKFLCHEEPVMINRCGEIMNKNIYVMAELVFDREEIYEYPLQLCDTLYLGPKGRILERPKHKITDIIQLENYHHHGQGIKYGTFNGVINWNGKQIIQNKWYLSADNRVKVEINVIHHQQHHEQKQQHEQHQHHQHHQQQQQHDNKRAAEVKIFAKKKENRYYYRINGHVSYTNDVIQQFPTDYPRDDCVIL